MSLHVHLLHAPEPDQLGRLEAQLAPGITLSTGPEVPPETHVLVAGRPEPDHLAACPDLKALLIPFAGLPGPTRELMQAHPHVAVYNLHHNAIPTAETAVALLLAAAKFIIPADRGLRQHDWSIRYNRPNPAILLHGKTALILGYGAIGQHAAGLCRGLGMRVLATKRRLDPDASYPDAVHSADTLPDLLPQADALIITLPLTDETRGLLGARELALLPPGAVLVNVGRAEVVDEAALFHALHCGQLHAAGLDVWYQYPADTGSRTHTPPASHPFHTLENVVLSPHRAGSGGAEEIEARRMQALAVLLNALARGETPSSRVDLAAGY